MPSRFITDLPTVASLCLLEEPLERRSRNPERLRCKDPLVLKLFAALDPQVAFGYQAEFEASFSPSCLAILSYVYGASFWWRDNGALSPFVNIQLLPRSSNGTSIAPRGQPRATE